MEIVAFIFSFNRPDYLAQVIRSLEKQTDRDIHYVLVQDGPTNKFSKRPYSNPIQISQCVDLFDLADLPHKYRILSRYNLGMAHQKLKAYTYAFKENDYDACICFEDDLVVANNYVRVMKALLEQFVDDHRVSTVQASDSAAKGVNGHLDCVKLSWRHFWGYGTWRDRWLKQEAIYMQYFNLVRNIDYRMRPHAQIRQLIKIRHSSHDGALDWTIKSTNMQKLVTVVPRATYIGKRGLHCTPDLFNRSGYAERLNSKIEFECDRSISEFKLET